MSAEVGKWIARALTAAGKVASGFPLHSECVWPGRRTDLFLAHESIYRFFSGWTAGKAVLDAGCGAGYGAALLVQSGAPEVVGIDIDARFVRYAARRYRNSRLEFRVGDGSNLPFEEPAFDVIVSSNALEHLESPLPFLAGCRRALRPGGALLVAVPWIVDEITLESNRSNPWHRTNLRVDQWAELFEREGWNVRSWVQTFDPAAGVPDFLDPRPSRRSLDAFRFQAVSVAEAMKIWSLGVVFHLASSPQYDPPGRLRG